MSLLLLLRHGPPPPEAPGIFIEPTLAYVLTIAGVTKKLQPGWSISEAANGRNTFTCEVLSLDATYRPAVGAEVRLTEDGLTIFAGFIQTPSEAGIGSRGFTAITTRISATDFNQLAERRTVSLDLPAGTLKQRLQAVLPYLSPYGVTLDPGQADGPVLPAVSYQFRLVRDLLDEWSTVSNGYLWEIDYNRVLRMVLPGAAAAPFSLTAANDPNVEGDISVESARGDYATKVIVMAGTGTRDIADFIGTGNGSVRAYQLHYAPSSFYLVNVGGTLVNGWPTGGVNETVGTPPAIWQYSPSNNVLVRNAALPLGSGPIYATMKAQFPVRVVADSGAPAADMVERVIQKTEIFDVNVAQAIANQSLARAQAIPRTVRYTTRYRNLHPGQRQVIINTKRNLVGTFLITEVRVSNVAARYVRRQVTAVDGTMLPETWRESFRDWTTGAGTSSGGEASGVVTVVSSGGVAGLGTPNRIAKWQTTTVVSDSIMSESGAAITVTGTVNAVGFAGEAGGLTRLPAEQLNGTIPASAIANRSLAELGGRSASDLNIGNLAYTRLPAGSGTWVATPTISGVLTLLADLIATAVTASGTIAAADIRLTVNNTPYKARNVAATADLPLISGDALDRTTLHCNSARLRVANPSTGAAPAGAALGVLNVTIDGIGDVAIPYY